MYTVCVTAVNRLACSINYVTVCINCPLHQSVGTHCIPLPTSVLHTHSAWLTSNLDNFKEELPHSCKVHNGTPAVEESGQNWTGTGILNWAQEATTSDSNSIINTSDAVGIRSFSWEMLKADLTSTATCYSSSFSCVCPKESPSGLLECWVWSLQCLQTSPTRGTD